MMKTMRACGAVVLSLLAACAAPSGAGLRTTTRTWVYVGSDGTQLRALSFDSDGRLGQAMPVADVQKPRWLVADPARPVVYVAVDGSGKDGSVAAYSIAGEDGSLRLLDEVPAGGGGTTFLTLDAPSRTLLAANFASGSVASLALKSDGSLAAPTSIVKAIGSGPHRRQASAHAHSIAVDPSGRYALVADMGADRVFVYGFDRAAHALSAVAAEPFVTPPGSGPRRAVFGATGRYVYVLNELSAEVMTLRWDAPKLIPLQSQSISSADFNGAKSAAEIAVSKDGRFVYIADRGERTLLVYAVDASSGELTLLQRLPSGGDAPWAFDVDASGRWLLVANFRSNRLNLFRIDPPTGRLSDTGQSVESPGPVSVTFVAK